MLTYSTAQLKRLAVHFVGNKNNNEDIFISKKESSLNQSLQNTLITLLLSPFKSSEAYNFFHDSEITLNELYKYCNDVFNNEKDFYLTSIKASKHLYNCSEHPKIIGGEFFVAYFKHCILDSDLEVDAIGFYKFENKDSILKLTNENDYFELVQEDGISVSKIEKACLVYNTDKEKGYRVSIIDNSSSSESKYWKETFINARSAVDDYNSTKNFLRIYKTFVTEELPEKFDVSKVDQIDFLNRSINFFKEEEEFSIDIFNKKVIQSREVAENFLTYKDNFQKDMNWELSDDFEISPQAVKKQARIYKSVIKLDKNFHLYIHGDSELVEKGYDKDKGLNFYKIYYQDEN